MAEERELQLFDVKSREVVAAYGKAARQLCDGAATKDARFAVAWRENDGGLWFLHGRDRLRINWCSAKSCSALAPSTKLPTTAEIIGFGCLKNACLVAARDGANAMALLTESGSVKWRQPLPAGTAHVAIVGVADRAFALALPGSVIRIDRDGKRTDLWHGAGNPVLAWSRGKLLVVHATGETVLDVAR